MQQFDGLGGTRDLPTSYGSLDRFTRAAAASKHSIGRDSFETDNAYAQFILDRVVGSSAEWRITYEPKELRAHFKLEGEEEYLQINLADLDFSCQSTMKVMDISGDVINQATPKVWEDYTARKQQQVLAKGNASVGNPVPGFLVNRMAMYPDSHTCNEAGSEMAAQ